MKFEEHILICDMAESLENSTIQQLFIEYL